MRALLVALALLFAAERASAQWTDLGFALPGTHGNPVLTCVGPLTAGSGLKITLTNAKLDEAAYLVIGLSAIYAPYKGGTLVPNFDLLSFEWTNHSGAVSLQTHWPEGVPAGIAFYLQYWIDDEAAIAGRAGSNAIRGITG